MILNYQVKITQSTYYRYNNDQNSNNNSFNDEKMKNYVIENYDSNKIAVKLYNKLKLMIQQI